MSEILDTSIKECTADNIDQIWKVAKIICSELLQREKWCFTGSFDDFTLPPTNFTCNINEVDTDW